MRNILAIAHKELRSYFASPIAYIVIGFFVLLYGYFFAVMLQAFMRASLNLGQFGASPQAFIMKLRIQAACEALQLEGAQIADVSRDLGFCDQSAFTHHFHCHMGMTPLKYLQQFRLRRS